MKCLKCDREIDDKVAVCPYCNHKISAEEIELELPTLKVEEEKIEKTRSISPIHESDLSLVDEINEEIENVNNNSEEKVEESDSVDVGDDITIASNSSSSILSTKESFKKRRIILGICILLMMSSIIIVGILISFEQKNSNDIVVENYMKIYEKALKTYYDSNDLDDIIILLQKYKDNGDVIKEYQEKTRVTCDSWLLVYVSEKVDTMDDFNEVTKKYENFLYGLNTYAVVKDEEKEVKALADSDYLELSNQLNSIYDDSVTFFDGLNSFNSKDYNEAYYIFEKIDTSNTYYEKAQYYLNLITNNVLEILKGDIKKLEKGISNLSVDEQLVTYSHIEEIIVGYDSVYMALKLTKNDEYLGLLQEYRSKAEALQKETENE